MEGYERFQEKWIRGVFFASLGSSAALGSCTADPVYLGVKLEGQPDPDLPEPYDCDPGSDLCFIDGSLEEADVRSFFEGDTAVLSDEVQTPVWHYPLSGSVHPTNLGLLTLHFEHAGEDERIFELVVSDGESQRRLYFPCLSAGGDGCLYTVPEAFWIGLASSFAGQDVSLQLRVGTEAGISAPSELPLSFSPEPVAGGLYYWSSRADFATGNEEGIIYRLVFGGREAVEYVVPRSPSNTQDCAGCHAVSRDGSTIAFSQGAAEPGAGVFDNAAFNGRLKVASVTALETPTIAPDPDTPSDTGMMTLSSRGDRVASAFDFGLELRDTASGDVLSELGQVDGKSAFFPEFSPNDELLVVTLTGEDDIDSEIGVRRGAIATISVVDDAFGDVTVVVPESDTDAHYYPTWSPDGNFIAFVSGPSGIRSYDQSDSRLRLVSVLTGEVFELERATGSVGMTSTWPKFAPFEQCPDASNDCPPDERIFFLSYSSKRRYGLIANGPDDVSRAQLWMSAIDVSRAESGFDPSSAPFWVPYQGPDTRNHLGYWTEALRCNETYGCASGQVCDETLGECIIVVR